MAAHRQGTIEYVGDSGRPAPTARSESRSPDPTTTGTDAAAGVGPGSAPRDVIMRASLAADRRSAAVVPIPRGSWVSNPGPGKNKINFAYAFGGPSLLTDTMENLAGVRVDHFAIVDLADFQALVDAGGEIDVHATQTPSDRGYTFRQGMNHLDGADSLVYVRQRHGLLKGAFERAHREQGALKTWLSPAVANGAVPSTPIEGYRLLADMSASVSVDDTLLDNGLALGGRHLQSSAVSCLNAPTAGFGCEGAQSVDYVSTGIAAEMWTTFRSGTISEHSASRPADELAEVPA